MTKLEVFDPPMCCSTGICGSSNDPTLVNFASDLEWLKKQGVQVVRHGLSFEPAEFAQNEEVKKLLNQEGNAALPILVISGKIFSKGRYPSREKLAALCNIEFNVDIAPPVHREENCCCGEDCDCSIPYYEKINSEEDLKCDCTNAPAEENCYCRKNFDDTQAEIKNKRLIKILVVIFTVLVLILLAVKFAARASADTTTSSQAYYDCINSLKQVNVKLNVAFIYLPSCDTAEMDPFVKRAVKSTERTLLTKNINSALYMMSPKSTEYYQLAGRTKPPAVLVIVKGKGARFVTTPITQANLLQAYLEAKGA